MTVNILEIENLFLSFGGVAALRDVSFVVPEDTITTVIGGQDLHVQLHFRLL